MAPLARGEMFGKTDAWRQAPSCTQLMFGRQVGRVISHSSPPQDVAAIAEELGVTEAAVAARRLVKYFEIVEWIVSMNLPQGTTYVWDCVGNSQ